MGPSLRRLMFYILLFFPFSHAWNTVITFHFYYNWNFRHAIGYRPSNLRPSGYGFCTNVPPGFCCRPIAPFANRVNFGGLPWGSISGVWQSDILSSACSGNALANYYAGPPTWSFIRSRISGASYVECPGIAPPGWSMSLVRLCPQPRRRSAAIAPVEPTWGYPDIIQINGTNYTDSRRGDMIYRNSDGMILDLNMINE